MRIHIATDHAGLDFSTQLQGHLRAAGHDVVDHGPIEYDAVDDYPAFCIRAAQAVIADQRAGVDALGVVFGGSGNGEQIAANKVAGIRAALCYSDELATLAREHNDAQVISIGGRMNTIEQIRSMVRTFITTPFSGAARHQVRIDMIGAYETDGTVPPLP